MNIKTSQIGLIGAKGKTGSVILSELLHRNIKVVTLVRNPTWLSIVNNKNLSTIIGDATNADKIDELVRMVDVVIDASNSRKRETSYN